jgi:hypothetical protein
VTTPRLTPAERSRLWREANPERVKAWSQPSPAPLYRPRWTRRDEDRVQEAEAKARASLLQAALRGNDTRPRTCEACGRRFLPHLVVDRPGESVCRPCLHLRGTA